MIFAYADPPYPGCAGFYPEKREVDHVALIDRLEIGYPDGWALSTSAVALPQIMRQGNYPMTARVMPWVKTFAVFKPNVGVAYAWEPVIVCGGRRRTREQATVRDWVSAPITIKRGLVGAKPDDFYYWLFSVLNVQSGDVVADLYPGTRGLERCLVAWLRQTEIVNAF